MLRASKKETDYLPELPPKPFSVSEYMDTMEKLHLKALQERENAKPHIIVLWWGFDGLRLNADGTREWIDRRPKKEDPTPKSLYDLIRPAAIPAYPATYDVAQTIGGEILMYQNEIVATTLDDPRWIQYVDQSIEGKIAVLESQLQMVNYEGWLTQQTQNAIGQIGRK